MRFAVTSATAGNDLRYLISSGLNIPPPLVISPSIPLRNCELSWIPHPSIERHAII